MNTLATNPDAMGVVFVIVWTALCLGVMHALSATTMRARGGQQ